MAESLPAEPRTYCEAHGVNLVQNGGRCPLCDRGVETLASTDESLPAADTLYAMLQEYPQARARTSLENIQDTLSLLAKWMRRAPETTCSECRRLRDGLSLIAVDEHRLMNVTARQTAQSILDGKPAHGSRTDDIA